MNQTGSAERRNRKNTIIAEDFNTLYQQLTELLDRKPARI